MINAYKMGNIAEADKIKKALTPAVDGQKKPNYRMLEEEETFWFLYLLIINIINIINNC